MKLGRMLAVLAALLTVFSLPVWAADVSYPSVLSGRVVSVVPAGTAVQDGDVLVTVRSLAGPMPAVRARTRGVVKTVLVHPGSDVKQGTVVVVVEEA
ncbi:hypothetical protein [uncultured Megasphaera sp.]|uniref:hypothetical protein n=1 Tax=uncultured Megasphaera sp. TaxID=165188 RepID=UPI00265B71C9|nr:hypothetical protein [uncultured Megasphaera sp.]